ncbi:MAG: AlpA family phage regulatory protein, partial [Betaproteobacteria bacterium]|nr:AlpA family phage regulatory protein [Betaproteobacteria bacterium]
MINSSTSRNTINDPNPVKALRLKQVLGLTGLSRTHTYRLIARGDHTTASHTAEAPRARAILLSSRPVSREEGIIVCQSLQEQISSHLGDGAVIFDESVYRGEQPIYTPVTTSELFHFNGNAVQVDALLQPTQAPSGIVRGTGLLLAMGAGLGGYEIPDRVEEGGRNPAVLAHVGYLRGSGVSEDLIPGMALNFNSSHCSPPLNDDEVLSIASRYEEKEKATTSEVDLGTSKWP